MPKAAELKKGEVLKINGELFVIRQIDVQSPSARGAATLYKIKASSLVSQGKFEDRFKGDEVVETAQVIRRYVQFSYFDGDDVIFMATDDYSQFVMARSQLEHELDYITEDIQGMQILLSDDQVVGLELPASVVLTVTETVPAMKAASASARTKPATLETGLVIQVPEYIEAGEKVKVNTTEGTYSSRVS